MSSVFSQSRRHELGQKGTRIQALLPGPTATEFWDIAGLPVHHLPSAIVMCPEDMVDATLAGLDQGEVVTIPGVPDKPERDRSDTTGSAIAARAEISGSGTPLVPNAANHRLTRSIQRSAG